MLCYISLCSFYQLVLEPELSFHPDHGLMMEGPVAMFTSLPESPLLTLSLQVPHAWFVEPVQSVYDLDNIHLAGVSWLISSNVVCPCVCCICVLCACVCVCVCVCVRVCMCVCSSKTYPNC